MTRMLKIKDIKPNYRVNEPYTLMCSFYESCTENLKFIRDFTTSPEKRKKPRTWSSMQAAELIGISIPTLKKMIKQYPDAPGVSFTSNSRVRITLKGINFFRKESGRLYTRPQPSNTIVSIITNLKGGVGKTTTAVDLAKKCSILGLRTLLIDLDAQATATLITLGLIPDLEIDYEETITNVLLEDIDKIFTCIKPTNFDGLDMIPANLAIQDCDLGLPNNKINNSDHLGNPMRRLEKALDKIKDDYDVILIDCGPNLGALTLNSITACNSMIIPIPPSMYDYASFTMYAGSLRGIFRHLNKPLEYLRILLTKHKGDNESSKMESLIRKQFGDYLLANSMCDSVEIPKAASNISSIYDLDSPEKNSAKTYRRALEHLDSLNNEIISNFKDIWEMQAQEASQEIQEAQA